MKVHLMIYAIETNNRAVAITDDQDVAERLNSDGILRGTVRHLKTTSGKALWNGVSSFNSRPATDAERDAYHQWAARAC